MKTITKDDFENYNSLKNQIKERTDEIFNLLKGITVGWNESYEYCTIDGDELCFRIGGSYRNEYDYEEHYRPLDYLFMSDEEIIKAEDVRLKELEEANTLREKEKEDALRKSEIEKLKELKKKYPNI